jgi:hypothetical protein
VPSGTPPDVRVVWEAPEPLLAEEADLGVDVDVAWDGEAPEHPLVTVGDSLTQGFKSLAITDTNLSWPAIVASELGLSAQQFTFPRYPRPVAGVPGLAILNTWISSWSGGDGAGHGRRTRGVGDNSLSGAAVFSLALVLAILGSVVGLAA